MYFYTLRDFLSDQWIYSLAPASKASQASNFFPPPVESKGNQSARLPPQLFPSWKFPGILVAMRVPLAVLCGASIVCSACFFSWLFSSWGLSRRVFSCSEFLFTFYWFLLLYTVSLSEDKEEEGSLTQLLGAGGRLVAGLTLLPQLFSLDKPPFNSQFSASCTVSKTLESELGKRVPGFQFDICLFFDNCIFEPLFIHQYNSLCVKLVKKLGRVVNLQRFSVFQLFFLSWHTRQQPQVLCFCVTLMDPQVNGDGYHVYRLEDLILRYSLPKLT